MSELDIGSHVLELVLKDTVLGECMLIDPYIEEYTFSTTYLLAWKLQLTLFKAASSEVGRRRGNRRALGGNYSATLV